jgi:putative copper export protein
VYSVSLYYANVTLHLLAALLWLGGMFFLGVVGAPVLRNVEPASLRAELFTRLGERFRTVGWTAIAALILTGLLNLHFRGMLGATLLERTFWSSPYGRALAWKLSAVVTMLAISAVHDFVVGPAAARVTPGAPGADALRKRAAWLARINALIGVGLVAAAVRLARGG